MKNEIMKLRPRFKNINKKHNLYRDITIMIPQDRLVFSLFLIFYFIFIYVWLHWVFVAVHGLSLIVASGGYSSLRCAGFSLRWLLLLRSTGSRHAGFSSCGSWAVERRLSSCGTQAQLLCGMWDLPPDQRSNPFPLHWQADSQPLLHQGSPQTGILLTKSDQDKYSPGYPFPSIFFDQLILLSV